MLENKRNEEKVNLTSNLIFSFFESFLSHAIVKVLFTDYFNDTRGGT